MKGSTERLMPTGKPCSIRKLGDVRQVAPLPHLNLPAQRLEFRGSRAATSARLPIRLKFLLCLARTVVKSPVMDKMTDDGLTADHPCKSTVKEKNSSPGALASARTSALEVRPAAMPLGDGSCSRRTNHPLIASGSEEPSHKIELVFSASLETVVGASGVETPSLNRPSAGPGSLHAV